MHADRPYHLFKLATSILLFLTFAIHQSAFGSDNESTLGSFLEKHNTVLSVDLSAGYSDNAYLTPSNTFNDTLINILIDSESTKDLGPRSSLYYSLSLERKQYMNETDASEIFGSLYASYQFKNNDWIFGISDVLIYEDYRIFDESGLVLFAGEYKAITDKLRAYVRKPLSDKHNLEAGIGYRMKDYMDVEYDYNRIEADILYSIDFTPNTTAELLCRYETMKYDTLEALYADGSYDKSTPALEIEAIDSEISLHWYLPNNGRAKAFASYRTASDTFEDEGSYNEQGFGANVIVQLLTKYAASAEISVYERNYDKRTIWSTGAIQVDHFTSARIMLERMIRGPMSAYCAYAINNRELDDSDEDSYDENVALIGIKHIL